ncbi:MAG TPA: nicotinate-nucleotide--dimethylbenzimidazole phosphoribosyltransferase, partial [Steroidobacteraceae bacterium]
PLAVRLALIQNTLKPRFQSPRIVVFAADHGLAVDDLGAGERHSTAATVLALLSERLPLAVFARLQGLELTVVDSGVAEAVIPHVRLLARKIAHGTRNSRAGAAMSTEQAHAAMRAGMEIGDSLGGSAVACAGIGIGSAQSAALLLSCMSRAPLREFIDSGPGMAEGLLEHLLRVLEGARGRHGHLEDPIELLAAVGGFEVAMMAGLMLAAASRRRLIIPDGMAACAALMIASAIAPAVPDYCVHARSNRLPGLDRALALFGAQALIEVGLDSIDGTGSTLAWPLVRCAAALLTDVADQCAQSPSRTAPASPPLVPVFQR